jgi:ribosome maturation factor RimP
MGPRDLADELFDLAAPVVEREGLVLIDVEAAPGPRVRFRFVIDGDGGAKIDDCVRVDRAVGDLLETWERAPRSYVVEVTSPGLDRRIRREAEYEHFRGRRARLHVEAEGTAPAEVSGVLEGMDGGDVLLRTGEEVIRVPADRIRAARLVAETSRGSGAGRKK